MLAMQSVVDALFAENEALPSFECQLVLKNGSGWKGAPKKQTDGQREKGVLEMIGVGEQALPDGRKTAVKTRLFFSLEDIMVVMTIEELRISTAQMVLPGLGMRA